MKEIIHIVKHKMTGAEVPIIVKSMSPNKIVEDYEEYTKDRKVFTLSMLTKRWSKKREDVISILKKYEVPVMAKKNDIKLAISTEEAINMSFFFEEYIYALEEKCKISHIKLKAKVFNDE